AAFSYGADAVYLGLARFSARAYAANFTADQIAAIVSYAKMLSPPRKVYLAVNTLMLESERGKVIHSLAECAEAGVDAFIVQDWGIAYLVRKFFPMVRLHASTQMAVHGKSGVEVLAGWGFDRVILARELTIEEIRACASTGIAVEVFVHGALCYSISGLCIFSSHMTGRSGNRGTCAQCCRNTFYSRNNEAYFPFSMKDIALDRHIEELVSASVAALKIEGRMKSPLYVAAVTDHYRKVLDKKLSDNERKAEEENLKTIFSRQWTELYFRSHYAEQVTTTAITGHQGVPIATVKQVKKEGGGHCISFITSCDIEVHDGIQINISGCSKPFSFSVDGLMVCGQNGKFTPVCVAKNNSLISIILPKNHPIIPEGATIYYVSSQAVKRKYAIPHIANSSRLKYALTVRITVDRDLVSAQGTFITRTHGMVCAKVDVNLEAAAPQSNMPESMQKTALEAFGKLGDTFYELQSLSIDKDKFIQISILNRLRRLLVQELDRQREQSMALFIATVENDDDVLDKMEQISIPAWILKVDNLQMLSAFTPDDWASVTEVVVPLDHHDCMQHIAVHTGRERIRISIPTIMRSWEEKDTRQAVQKLLNEGWHKWEVSNPFAWDMLEPLSGDMDVSADWQMFVTNTRAGAALASKGISWFTLSPEDGFVNMQSIIKRFGNRAAIILYQDTPLFISETKAREIRGSCNKNDDSSFELRSDHGQRVLVVNRGLRTVVINTSPYCIAGRLNELLTAGACRFRVYFSYKEYSPTECVEIWRAVLAGRNVSGSHEGNFERGLR
ncbi:U32 family peptidase, partial [Candidatus Desantisbacteria bacterium]|nr:U32 family peptidase [Candidatus Desantisbacteria bacterium]